ncbi:MAG: NPCBM/NEW2 domain-containing protein [Pirellulales bacterium]
MSDEHRIADHESSIAKRCRPIALVVACFVAACVAAGVSNRAAANETLILLDGKRIEADVTAIDAASGRISAEGLDRAIELQGLRSLVRPKRDIARAKGAFEVHLTGGGVVMTETLKIADERVTFRSAYGEAALPIEAVRAAAFATDVEATDGQAAERPAASDQGREALAAALAQPPGEKDRLLVVVEGKVQTLLGLVSEWQAAGVAFDWEGETRQIPYTRVYAIVLAQLGPAHDATGECAVATTDGSTITGRVAGLADGQLAVRLHQDIGLSVPWDAVESITIKSDRLVFLSDLKPAAVQVRPVVTLERPPQVDRGVMGGPLSLAGQTFEKGLGVMSRTELAFDQPTGFDALAATIGIDDSAAERGNCEFVVLVDGREAFRATMTGKTPPREIRVSTAGGRRVSLVVEPGDDLDLADHADWCDARLLKSEK